MTLRSIINEAKKLTTEEQLRLRDEIDRIVEGTSDSDVALTRAQATDLKRRTQELRSGKVKLIAGDEALKKLRRRD
jgi:hypothetical protein